MEPICMAPRWLMPMPWPKRRASTRQLPAPPSTAHSSFCVLLMLMPRALSSSEKMSKVSVSAQGPSSVCAVTSKSSFVYSRLGEGYFGVWGVTLSMRVTCRFRVLLPMACRALSMIYMAPKKGPDESVIYENLTPSA